MRVSGSIGWLLLPGIASAMPGLWRRQAQSASDCTCPANGPVTTTVVQYTIVTSSTTVTSQGSTVFSTGPASTQTVVISSTSTATVITGTTTITRTQTTVVPSDSTTTLTDTVTTTVCNSSGRKIKRQIADKTSITKVKRQNTDSTTTTYTDSRPIITYTSTISSRVVTCTCTPRPRTTTLASSSSTCQCPATTSTVTVSSVSSGVVVVTVVQQTPTLVVITPTEVYTSTSSSVTTSSDLATVETTQTSSTITINSIETEYVTETETEFSCPPSTSTDSGTDTSTDSGSDSTTSTQTSSQSSTLTSIGPTASASGSFGCNATAYYVATLNNVVSLYNIDLTTGSTITFATNVGAGTYTTLNGMGFNTRDNFLYAIATISTGNYAVVRVATTGALTQILRFQSSTNPGSVGDFDTNGQFYFSGGGLNWYHVDLLPGSATYGTIINNGTTTLNGYTVLDWSYLYGQGDYMYSLGRTTDSSPNYALLRWSLTSHTWSLYQSYPGTTASNSLIANWGGNNGTIWGLQATSGRITRVILGGTPTEIATGPTGITGGDGARCALSS